jgi:hypothetical protein
MKGEIFFFGGNPKAQKPINSLSLSLSLSLCDPVRSESFFFVGN